MASANATVDVPVDDANEKRQSTEKDISQPGERAEEEEKKISSGAAYFVRKSKESKNIKF